MNYNSDLQGHNTDLQGILDTINNLPDQKSVSLQTKTATPSASSQTITPDSGYDGLSKVTVSGDSNLVASNIKSGASIFGVEGTVVEQEDLDTVMSEQDSLISQIQTALAGKAAGSGSSIGTCTINVEGDSDCTVGRYGYTYLDTDGTVKTYMWDRFLHNGGTQLDGPISLTFQNVVCGSMVHISAAGMCLSIYPTTDNMTIIDSDSCFYTAPTENGAVGVITIIGDD